MIQIVQNKENKWRFTLASPVAAKKLK